MKKAIVCLLILIMSMPSCFALNAADYPAYSGSIAGEQLGGTVDGTSLLLDFDASLDYSYVSNGTVQACFFAYNEQKTSYIELYLLLPENASAGDVITPAYCQEHGCSSCSASVSEVTELSSTYFTVFSSNGTGYPSGTDFKIEITSISQNDGTVSVSGTLSAVLCRFDGLNQVDQMLTIENAAFSCSVLPRDSAGEPQTTPGASSMPDSGTSILQPTPTPFGVKV